MNVIFFTASVQLCSAGLKSPPGNLRDWFSNTSTRNSLCPSSGSWNRLNRKEWDERNPDFLVSWGLSISRDMRLAPSWLVSSVGRALHQYCNGHALTPAKAWIFFRVNFHYCSSYVHNCEDHWHLNSLIPSSNMRFTYTVVTLIYGTMLLTKQLAKPTNVQVSKLNFYFSNSL